MNAFQTCRNTSDAVPLYLPQQLYLKPAARLTISIQLPNVKKLQKSISHWEIMEKLRTAISPDEFSSLKVVKTTIEVVRFEGELENRTRLEKVISKLNNNSIKLKEIPDLVRVKAGEMKSEFPTRAKWDDFFHESRDMDEMKPGQRPDTVHLWGLPIKWFVAHQASDEDDVPSEKLLYRVFEKFGSIRYVDIPICDPYRKKMKEHISGIKAHTLDENELFEGYVQFKDYIGFTKAMDALRGMKLVKKDVDEALSCCFKADFDRSMHLSDASIRRREIVRERLVKKQRDKEEKEKNELDEKKKKENNDRQKEIDQKSEKEQRRKDREAKRKAKILDKLKVNGCDEINDKIAKEEKKLLKAQRKLEAIRLLEELFRRIKDKKDELQTHNRRENLNGDELRRYKDLSELAVLNRRQKLHNAIEGRVVLKSILSGKKGSKHQSSSSESSLSISDEPEVTNGLAPDMLYDPSWYPYPYGAPMYAPPLRGGYHMYPPRSRGAGPSRGRPFGRGRFRRGRGYRPGGFNSKYNPEMEEQYARYFSKFFTEHDDRRSRRCSSSRSRRRSPSRSRSRSHRRSWSRSYTKSRSRSRTRRRSESHFTPEQRRRSKSVDSSQFISPKSMRKRRSKSRSTSPERRK